MGMNMMSAKKVKLHGMQDCRWTVKDQLLQYRALLKLFERGSTAMDTKTKSDLTNDKKFIKAYLRLVVQLRREFKTVVDCDRQKIQNLLNEDQELKLAFKDLELQKIIDHMQHVNFTVRKRVDLLDYKQKMKEDHLIKLKLEEGDLETHLQYTKNVKSPAEIQIGILTGKVQDMILKKEAAITVNTTYKTLIQLLKKDAIYYDSLLDTLKEDGREQCNCIIQTIKLGQLAVEFLDDRKTDFDKLHAQVRRRNKMCMNDLRAMRELIEKTAKSLRHLIKRDFDIKVSTSIFESKKQKSGRRNTGRQSAGLSGLRSSFRTIKIEELLPRLIENKRQFDRLVEILDAQQRRLKDLQKKVDEARELAFEKELSVNSDESGFLQRRAELEQCIMEQKNKQESLKQVRHRRNRLSNVIREGFRLLTDIGWELEPKTTCRESCESVCELMPLERDVAKQLTTINLIINEISKVVPLSQGQPSEEAKEAYMELRMAEHREYYTQMPAEQEEEYIEDIQVPTRQFIKWQSGEVVTQALKRLIQ